MAHGSSHGHHYGQIKNQLGAAEVYPVTLDEAKTHLRVYHDDDDAYITALIGVCTQHTETVTSRTYVQREFEIRTSFTQGSGLAAMIPLELIPVQSVESVAYINSAGDTITLDPSFYGVETGERPLVYPKAGASWPTADANTYKPVTITVKAGYAPTDDSPPDLRANVPMPIKQAILLLVGQMYENREPVHMGPVNVIPLTYDALVYPYRVRLGF